MRLRRPCIHGQYTEHVYRVYRDAHDPLENQTDGSGNPYLGDGLDLICPGGEWLIFAEQVPPIEDTQ